MNALTDQVMLLITFGGLFTFALVSFMYIYNRAVASRRIHMYRRKSLQLQCAYSTYTFGVARRVKCGLHVRSNCKFLKTCVFRCGTIYICQFSRVSLACTANLHYSENDNFFFVRRYGFILFYGSEFFIIRTAVPV